MYILEKVELKGENYVLRISKDGTISANYFNEQEWLILYKFENFKKDSNDWFFRIFK